MTRAPEIVRLANERVPVMAIARGLALSAEDVWSALRAALGRGEIAALPRPDWTPGRPGALADPPPPCAVTPDAVMRLQGAFGLTRGEARMLAVLIDRGEATRQVLHAAVDGRPDPLTGTKSVEVLMCHLRRKIAPLVVKTLPGSGYALGPEARAALRARLAERRS